MSYNKKKIRIKKKDWKNSIYKKGNLKIENKFNLILNLNIIIGVVILNNQLNFKLTITNLNHSLWQHHPSPLSPIIIAFILSISIHGGTSVFN